MAMVVPKFFVVARVVGREGTLPLVCVSTIIKHSREANGQMHWH